MDTAGGLHTEQREANTQSAHIAVCMVEVVRWCLARVAEHVHMMWSYMEGFEMKETQEQINGRFQCLGQGPWAKLFICKQKTSRESEI